MYNSLLVKCLVLLFTVSSYSQVLYEEIANELGVDISSNTTLGGGVSFCDFDGDGRDDLTIATQSGVPIRFFRNTGGDFEEVFLIDDDPLYTNKQVIWVDIDNDGDKDLFSANQEFPNILYENVAGVLVDITSDSGLPTEAIMTNSGNWGDYDNDGYLDVFLGNRDTAQLINNMLFRNNGDNTFTDVTISSGIGNRSELTFQGTFFDYNNDGHLDLYLINDRIFTLNILYRNNGDGTFTDVSVVSGTNYQMDGMSVAVEDYNADGFLDVYITNVYNPDRDLVGNVLMKNNGDGTFSNIALESNVRFDTWSWGANWTDADNNGDLDLYVSGASPVNTSELNSAALYLSDGAGLFNEINDSGFEDDLANSFGNAVGDINQDGYQDIFVSNHLGYNSYLWLNKTNTINSNNWIALKMQGVVSNRDGSGARIEIMAGGKKQYRVVTLGESYLSQNSNTEIFGLGTNDLEYVRINWPSGIEDFYDDIAANQRLTMIEGEGYLNINSFNQENNVQLFPNPSTNAITITNNYSPINHIAIYNMFGQLVLSHEYQEADSLNLNIEQLATGTYVVKVKTANTVVVKKLIKR